MLGSRQGVVILAVVGFLSFQAASVLREKKDVRGLRVVLLSDAHVIGPQYVCCSESNDVDNDSIMKTESRLRDALAAVRRIEPRPDIAVFLGDVIHQGYLNHDFAWYVSERNAYTIAHELFRDMDIPLRFLWGNHDYKVTCGDPDQSYVKDLSHRLFHHFFHAQPYSSFLLGPYRFILLNGMLGPSWDPSSPQCNTKVASLGVTQLEWLDKELGQGDPTFVFLHHPLPATMINETLQAPHGDVVATLRAHQQNILHVFSGHYHRGNDWEDLFPFKLTTLPAVRYDSDNFFVLDLSPDGRGYSLVDWAKNKGGNRCSDTWSYTSQGNQPVPGAQETGTCGEPDSFSADAYHLAPVAKGQIPANFNPEPACPTRFIAPILSECLAQGASAACCQVVTETFRPTSSGIFPSCSCKPSFWSELKKVFSHAGQDAEEVFARCATEHGSPLQYLGQPGGVCKDGGG